MKKKCLQCKTGFESKRTTALFCSPQCRKKHHRESKRRDESKTTLKDFSVSSVPNYRHSVADDNVLQDYIETLKKELIAKNEQIRRQQDTIENEQKLHAFTKQQLEKVLEIAGQHEENSKSLEDRINRTRRLKQISQNISRLKKRLKNAKSRDDKKRYKERIEDYERERRELL